MLRAPLLWALLPLMAGYICTRAFPSVSTPSILIALVPLFLSLYFFRSNGLILKTTTATAFLVFGLFWSGYLESPVPPVEEGFKRSWTKLTVKVERFYDTGTRWKRMSGIARIVEAPDDIGYLEGYRMHFQVPFDHSQLLSRGALLEIRGQLRRIRHIDGGRDAEFLNYVLSTGVHFTLFYGELHDVQSKGTPFYHFCKRSQMKIYDLLGMGVPEEEKTLAGVYRAMLLGTKSAMLKRQKDRFIQTGTMHFFAISGLHVGVIAGALFLVLRLARMPEMAAAVVGLLILFLYVQITEARPSAVRAYLMIATFWGARAFLRQPMPFAALITSAFLVLLIDPAQLWSAGFQLSYGVVSALLIFGIPLGDYLRANHLPWQEVPRDSLSLQRRTVLSFLSWTYNAFAISAAAWLASLPLITEHFHIVSPLGIVINLLLITLASFTLFTGLLTIACGLVWTELSTWINGIAWVLISIMEWVVDLFLNLPYAYLVLNYPYTHFGYIALAVMLFLMYFSRSVFYDTKRSGWLPSLTKWCPALWAVLIILFAL